MVVVVPPAAFVAAHAPISGYDTVPEWSAAFWKNEPLPRYNVVAVFVSEKLPLSGATHGVRFAP
jgi:hypothetical protein